MFTVVIAAQEHISSIEEYHMFLRPFLEQKEMVFCEWLPEKRTLQEAVPTLAECVARNQEWRAVVVCGEQGLQQRNPFDLAPFTAPKQDAEEEKEAYFSKMLAEKCRAYDAAAQQPLTRLMTYLCEAPLIEPGTNSAAWETLKAEDRLEYQNYQREAQYKQKLREQIIDGEETGIPYPAEILCIAPRTCEEKAPELDTSWTAHVDLEYSNFYDRNLYFDKMRYLVFDILPKTHQDYNFDYLRFLYVVLMLAGNEIPQGSLRPHRVYSLLCDNDEEALHTLLGRYEGKLVATDALLEQKLHEIETKVRPRLSDQEAEAIFCGKVVVPITFVSSFDRSTLFIPHDGLGLSTDCPASEYGVLESGYAASQKAMHRFLKQPRRAIKRAAEDMRELSSMDPGRIRDLNSFQLEDVEEHVADEELTMVGTVTEDFRETERYYKEIETAHRAVERKIETRMTRRTTVAIGASVLLIYLLGFLPLLFSNRSIKQSTILALLLTGAALVLMALVGLVCLLFLRRGLNKMFRMFNAVMQGLVDQVSASMDRFSAYLSHMCNAMRGFSVLNHRAEHRDPDDELSRIYRKHRLDLLRCREELRETFGSYLPEDIPEDEQAYPYDFRMPVDFSYPVPFTADQRSMIGFVETGNEVMAPVRFVRSIKVRMEELYE